MAAVLAMLGAYLDLRPTSVSRMHAVFVCAEALVQVAGSGFMVYGSGWGSSKPVLSFADQTHNLLSPSGQVKRALLTSSRQGHPQQQPGVHLQHAAATHAWLTVMDALGSVTLHAPWEATWLALVTDDDPLLDMLRGCPTRNSFGIHD